MDNLVRIEGPRVFTVQEVNSILPLVIKWTRNAKRQVDVLKYEFDQLDLSEEERRSHLLQQMDEIFSQWEQKLIRMGAKPSGTWVADFDFGEGYYCWKYPEPEILFWHGYEDGLSGRRSVRPQSPVVSVPNESRPWPDQSCSRGL